MTEELYINGNYIELGDESKIGLTIQVNDISNMSGRNGSFSNEFKVPKTKNNQIALEFCSGLNSNSKVPYAKNICRYIQNGIEIVSNGIAIVNSYDGGFKIQVTTGNGSPFELMAQRALSDIDFTDLEETWTMAHVIAANANTEGIIYPIIDYNGASLTVRQIDVRRLMPAIFAKTILDRIVEAIGYTYSGDFKVEKFADLLIPLFSDANQTLDFPIQITASAAFSPDLSASPAEAPFVYVGVLDTRTTDSNAQWTYGDALLGYNYLPGWVFIADISNQHGFELSLPYTSTGTGQITVRLSFLTFVGSFLFPEPTIKDVVVAAGSSGIITMTENQFLNFGDIVSVTVCSSIQSDTITFSDASYLHIDRAQISDHAVFGTVFPIAVNMPNIKQADYVKLISQKYNLSFQTNEYSKNIAFTSFKKITENMPVAKTWSGKMDINKINIEFTIGNYAQSNVFQYTSDESVNFGNLLQSGIISIKNETLPLSQVVVQSPFAETEMKTKLNGLDVPYINKYDVITDSFNLATIPRILYLDKQNLASPLVYLDGSTTNSQSNTIPLCYFVLPDKSNLGWANNLLENNYAELQSILNNVKKITAFFKLNIIDVSEMDFSIPIYLDVQTPKMQINGYFYVNKISNYMAGKLTQCELIRL
ncbi:MAG: hypothetical protein V4549_18150 [Bacteroidota bacterium]